MKALSTRAQCLFNVDWYFVIYLMEWKNEYTQVSKFQFYTVTKNNGRSMRTMDIRLIYMV